MSGSSVAASGYEAKLGSAGIRRNTQGDLLLGSLEEISWEEWYEKFKDNNLTFLYQDKTKDGKESRFFKLVCMADSKSR